MALDEVASAPLAHPAPDPARTGEPPGPARTGESPGAGRTGSAPHPPRTGTACPPRAGAACAPRGGVGAVRRTGDWCAAARAEEYALPDRFLDDPYAALLADDATVATLRELRRLGAPVELVVLRGRLGDEALRRAVAHGTGQAVCLGAGSDTRAWRARLPARFRYFEVDLPGRSRAKARLIDATIGAQPTCHWRPVEADLRGDWPAALRAAGLRTDEPVHWILEGVTFYLPAVAAEELVRAVSELSAPGSTVVGDVLGSTVFTHPPYRPFLDRMAALGWVVTPHDRFGEWLTARGWQARGYRITDLVAGRHPLLPAPPPRRFDIDQPRRRLLLRNQEGSLRT
jgi:methyltransferase (TIGR00027 family)